MAVSEQYEPIERFVKEIDSIFPQFTAVAPWHIPGRLPAVMNDILALLNHDEYTIVNDVAIHKTAVIEQYVTIKAPAIIAERCFVGASAYLRGGVYLGPGVSVGPGCEVKSSVIFHDSHLAHFNFVGDSIIGSRVNLEAGAVTANHYNERSDQSIVVVFSSGMINTGVTKFGSLIGDDVKIGANAVLSPGTIVYPGTVIKRLQLVDQAGSYRS